MISLWASNEIAMILLPRSNDITMISLPGSNEKFATGYHNFARV
jgi:hypothetical protein